MTASNPNADNQAYLADREVVSLGAVWGTLPKIMAYQYADDEVAFLDYVAETTTQAEAVIEGLETIIAESVFPDLVAEAEVWATWLKETWIPA